MLAFRRAQLFVVAVIWAVLILNTVSGIKSGHGKEDQDKFDDHVVSYNFIDNYLRQSASSDRNMGDFIWSLLYHNPSAFYSSGLAFKKKRNQAWLSDSKRNQMWHAGNGKRDTQVDEASASGKWPTPSMVLHPPWYGHRNEERQRQFNIYNKRQQGWHTSYGKRQQGWYNPYG